MSEPTPLPDVIIYTDGACDPNPGPGGWVALLFFSANIKTLSGRHPNTTYNRMELQAARSARAALNRPCQVRLHTDSEYIQKGVTEHLASQKAKGWRTSAKKALANRDLWENLDVSMQPHQIIPRSVTDRSASLSLV